MRRRSVLALLATSPAIAPAAESSLPVPDSLERVANQAARRGEPLILLISLPGCPYCELVRRNYLLPMRAQGLAAWQLTVNDTAQAIRDFQGQASTGAAIALQLKIRVTPTVLFFTRAGREVAGRLEGIAVPDFYGAYLDEALGTARKRLSGNL